MSDESRAPLATLLLQLKGAFPTAIDIDYYSVLGVASVSNFISETDLAKFRALNAAIQLLIEQDIMRADRFDEGRDTYFWNARLTGHGYRRLDRAAGILETEDLREALVALSWQE